MKCPLRGGEDISMIRATRRVSAGIVNALLFERKVEDLDGVSGKAVSEAGCGAGDGGGDGDDFCRLGDGVGFLGGLAAESYERCGGCDAICAAEFDGNWLRDG